MHKREHPKEKAIIHPRNKHRERYNFQELMASCPELQPYIKINEFDDETIDFANPEAVKLLNKSLLLHFYKLKYWDIPKNYLCPPIPGRADYIHHIADLLAEYNRGLIPKGNYIKCLDIGTGANCIYPIIGASEYDWSYVGSDIDPISLSSAEKIVQNNPVLKGKIELRLQSDRNNFFKGLIIDGEKFDLSICNPPFHASQQEAQSGTMRKLKNLKLNNSHKAVLNFGGKNNELWCEGGEHKFITNMIQESKHFEKSCFWFSSLISKQSNLKSAYYELNKVNTSEIRTIQMGQGNKISRVVAWTFLDKAEQIRWVEERWKS